MNEPVYEASFFSHDGNWPDIMFDDCEVQDWIEVIDLQEAAHPEDLQEFRRRICGVK